MSQETDVDPERAARRDAEPVDAEGPIGSLSPSGAGDFLSCPLLYRYRRIDRLPEPTSREAARGTVVHKVLEELYDLSPADRTPEQAAAMVAPVWERLREAESGLAELFPGEADPADGIEEIPEEPPVGEPVATPAVGASSTPLADTSEDVEAWLASCRATVARYFVLEDPVRLEPAEREVLLEAILDSRLLLRGIIDRLDVRADGAVRVVDYKTGRAPREGFEARALFQLRFYALMLWRTRGVVPAMLQLVYLGSGEIVRYEPDADDLLATQRKIGAVWAAIERAEATGEWLPSRNPLCAWCAHQSRCPEFGGTVLPLPSVADARTDAGSSDGSGDGPGR